MKFLSDVGYIFYDNCRAEDPISINCLERPEAVAYSWQLFSRDIKVGFKEKLLGSIFHQSVQGPGAVWDVFEPG